MTWKASSFCRRNTKGHSLCLHVLVPKTISNIPISLQAPRHLTLRFLSSLYISDPDRISLTSPEYLSFKLQVRRKIAKIINYPIYYLAICFPCPVRGTSGSILRPDSIEIWDSTCANNFKSSFPEARWVFFLSKPDYLLSGVPSFTFLML